MATLPISGLLAEFEVLAFETLDFGAEVSDFLAQSRHQGDQLPGGVAGATDLYQLAIHDQPGLPKMDRRGKRLVPTIREEANWQTQLRRCFTMYEGLVVANEPNSPELRWLKRGIGRRSGRLLSGCHLASRLGTRFGPGNSILRPEGTW